MIRFGALSVQLSVNIDTRGRVKFKDERNDIDETTLERGLRHRLLWWSWFRPDEFFSQNKIPPTC